MKLTLSPAWTHQKFPIYPKLPHARTPPLPKGKNEAVVRLEFVIRLKKYLAC
jgi:hypothetical protein